MPNIPADSNDPRSRVSHQGYLVSGGGLEKTNGIQGIDSMLQGSADLTFQVNVPGAAGTYRYNLPPHLFGTTYSVIKAAGAGTITATKLANGTNGAVTLINAATSVAAKAYGAALDAAYPHEDDYNGQETLEIVVAGSPTSDFTLAFHLHVAITGWK